MAKEFDNTNRGVLFKNKDKQDANHPDYNGKINVGGKDFWLSAWIKTSKAGEKYMSLSVKPATAKQEDERPREKVGWQGRWRRRLDSILSYARHPRPLH